jgi:hypothetical protein
MNDTVAGSLWGYLYDPMDRLVSADELNGLSQAYKYNSIGNLMQVYDSSNYVNYTYGSGAGPHAVTSTFVSDYFYASFNVTSSCLGVVP